MTQRPSVLINIDVDDLEAAARFYTEALGLRIGRRFAEPWLELLGASAPIYLLEKKPRSVPVPGGSPRDYGRHWTPVHLDFVVPDIAAAVARAVGAGATLEQPAINEPYGKLALLACPWGHGFCLIELNEVGYDAPALYRAGP